MRKKIDIDILCSDWRRLTEQKAELLAALEEAYSSIVTIDLEKPLGEAECALDVLAEKLSAAIAKAKGE